jgi:hypothetical protein
MAAASGNRMPPTLVPGCRRQEALVAGLRLLLEDPRARRDWLWLRAREKGDVESLLGLERADPGLPARMDRCDALARSIADPRSRRDVYGVMADRLSIDAGGICCECPACRRRPDGMLARAMGVDRLGLVDLRDGDLRDGDLRDRDLRDGDLRDGDLNGAHG